MHGCSAWHSKPGSRPPEQGTVQASCSFIVDISVGFLSLQKAMPMSTTPNDCLAEIEQHLLRLGSSDWIEIYRREKTDAQGISLTSGLVPEARSNEVLSETGWAFDPQD